MQSYVYLLSNQPRGTLYIGVTSDLIQRIWQHKEAVVDGFSARHGLKTLMWYEIHEDISEAIKREKQLKNGTASGKSNWLKNLTQTGSIYIPVY